MPDMNEMKAPKRDLPPFAPRPIYNDIYPLDEFYAARGQSPPVLGRIEAGEVPEPYHSLLVHKTDMTSTLEKFHGEKLHVEVLARHNTDNEYYREVVLVLDASKKPVEYGAIKIILDLFPPEIQREILREEKPLGRILTDFHFAFSSHPGPCLRMASDSFIDGVLHLQGTQFLYGRRNSLVDSWDRPLAEIVEVLPP
jgi:chorismate-pyruvate lyase